MNLMNLDFRGRRTATLAALTVVGIVTATAMAQTGTAPSKGPAPDAAALQRKVDVLQKQVEALQNEVAALKRRQPTLRFTPPGQPEPPPGTPLKFNGRTYYWSLLQEGPSAPPVPITIHRTAPISPSYAPVKPAAK